jgi:hypothetical protein
LLAALTCLQDISKTLAGLTALLKLPEWQFEQQFFFSDWPPLFLHC